MKRKKLVNGARRIKGVEDCRSGKSIRFMINDSVMDVFALVDTTYAAINGYVKIKNDTIFEDVDDMVIFGIATYIRTATEGEWCIYEDHMTEEFARCKEKYKSKIAYLEVIKGTVLTFKYRDMRFLARVYGSEITLSLPGFERSWKNPSIINEKGINKESLIKDCITHYHEFFDDAGFKEFILLTTGIYPVAPV